MESKGCSLYDDSYAELGGFSQKVRNSDITLFIVYSVVHIT